jgi:hypothetical protein
MDKLFIATTNKLERWSLAKRERDAEYELPGPEAVTGLCMGSASNGPLLCVRKGGWDFLDPDSFKALGFTWPSAKRRPAFAAGPCRASADGRVFTTRIEEGRTNRLQVVVLRDRRCEVRQAHSGVWLLAPGHDGRWVYSSGGVWDQAFQPLRLRDHPTDLQHPFLPSVHASPFFVQLWPRGRAGEGSVRLFVLGQEQPFTELEKVAGVGVGDEREPLTPDKRLFFVPDANLLIGVLPEEGRLALRRCDPEALLKRTTLDWYLCVVSRPPTSAPRGGEFSYRLSVRSSKEVVAYRVAEGPPGMTVSEDGQVKWSVPADFAEPEAAVRLAVLDGNGAEVSQTFTLSVP